MDLVLFHSGNVLPKYLEACFKQIRIFNPDITIHFLTNNIHLASELFPRYKITPHEIESLYNAKIKRFETLYGRERYNFWTITATRLFYLETFLKRNNLENVYFFENDVMLYYDLNEHHDKFLNLYDNIAITVGGDDKIMTGFSFIKSYKPLEKMTNYFISLIEEYGLLGIKNNFKVDMVNEMTLMRLYSYYSSNIDFLPIMPFGKYLSIYNEFKSIFDPASYGQFVGGTPESEKSIKPDDHYIGKMLQEHEDYKVVFEIDELRRFVPFFVYNGNHVKINNLHIHSKKLHKYLS